LLDLILIKEPNLSYNVQDLGKFGTRDHKLIYCNLDIDTTEEKVNIIQFNYKRINIDEIKAELSSIDWDEVSKGSVKDCLLRLKTTLKDLQQRFVPLLKHKKNSSSMVELQSIEIG